MGMPLVQVLIFVPVVISGLQQMISKWEWQQPGSVLVITRNAPLSLKGIKKIITMFENNMALNQSNLDKADQIMQKCFQSDDLKEGQAAFMEKRPPKFIGEWTDKLEN